MKKILDNMAILEVTARTTYQEEISDSLYKDYKEGKYTKDELIDILETTLYSTGNIVDIDIYDSVVYETE